jgi:uncharacterized membrane protein
MEQARLIAKDGYWFTGFTLVFMIIEFVVVVVYLICLYNSHQSSNRSSSYAETATPSGKTKETELM